MKRFFSSFFEYCLRLASKPGAIYILFLYSFIESWFIIPIPPDVMLAPMTLSKPDKAFLYANITTLGSLLGGVLGFLIGFYAIDFAMEFINTLGLIEYYQQAVDWFEAWGPAIILIAGFTIIPFKVFTIMAGAMKMNFIFFIFATIISRGLRFYLVAYAAKIGGEKGLPTIRKNIDKLGYFIIFMFLIFIAIKSWG